MNKNLHRIVFNRARGLWMAVAETAAAQGKDAAGRARSAAPGAVSRPETPCAFQRLAGALLLALGLPAGHAQIVADPGAPRHQQPTVLNAANGVPVVNIQTPSAAGVSRNTYRQFDVSRRGAILNNSRTDTSTQLGGWVQGNPWLAAGGARVILNEVNASAPSQLRGHVEVAGQRAEVVIANPAGIQVDGGGFLNASRVTLTTGTPVVSGGALEGYRVQGGLVRIEGAGLDARGVDYTQVLARAVELNAGVWARELEVVTGAHQYDAARGQAHATTSAQPAPAVSLDVAHLGGMYAGKIRLVGTEAGLGVRNAGTVAATQGDLVVDANGWLSNTGTLQSAGALQVEARGAGLDNQGTVAAQGRVTLRGQRLDNRHGLVASVQGDVDVAAARLDNSGGRLLAGRDVSATAAHFVNAMGHVSAAQAAHLHSTDQALDNQGGLVTAQSAVVIQAAGMNNTGGAVHSGGSLTIDTRGGLLDNRDAAAHPQGAGGLVAAGALTLRAGELDNRSGRVASGGALQVEVAGLVHNGSGPAGAGGQLLSQGTLTLDAGQWDNRGGLVEAAGDVRVQAAHGLDNTAGLVRSGAQLTVQAGEVVNADTAGGDRGLEGQRIDLTAAQLNNQDGAVRATQHATLAVAGTLDNTAGLLSAGHTLALSGGTVHNEGGTLLVGAGLEAQMGALHGAGRALSLGDLRLAVSGAFDHTGELAANGTLALQAGSLTNRGRIQAGEQLQLEAATLDQTATGELSAPTATLQVRETLTNRGLIDGGTVRIEAGELHNLGTGRLYGDQLSLHATRLVNDTETVAGTSRDAVIAARERLDIGTQHLLNRDGALIFSAGDLAIGGSLDAQGRATGAAASVTNASATIDVLGHLDLRTGTLLNSNLHFATTVVPGAPTRVVKLLHNGVEYDQSQVGTNFGALDQYWNQAGWRVLLPSAEYPFDRFPADVASWAVPLPMVPFWIAGTEACGYPSGEDGCAWIQENYPRDHGIWQRFGVTPPPAYQGPDCSIPESYCSNKEWIEYQAAQEAKTAARAALDERIVKYNQDVLRRTLMDWYVLSYDRTDHTPVVTSTAPARILVGGNLRADVTTEATNDKSQIVVGGDLVATGATVRNVGAEATGWVTQSGQVVRSYFVEHDWHDSERRYAFAAYNTRTDYTATLAVAETRTHTTPAGTGTQLAAHAIHPVTHAPAPPGAVHAARPTPSFGPLPSNSLFRVQPDATAGYLIETDPRFADRRQWLASDYMLRQLALDPAATQKRLGDGFYEQRLVREQIGQLTGRRFLQGHASDEAQYRALMDAGVTFAREHQLRPGVALTAEQVAQLTSDIVWLVERSVTLTDGSTQQVLVPQVYLRPRPEDLDGHGTLISADRIGLELAGELVNSGTIAGRRVVALDAQHLRNLGGRITGHDVALSAQQDLLNLGGRIEADASLHLAAGRDLTVASTTRSTAVDAGRGSHYERTTLDRLAGLYVGAPGGTLVASAGRDLALQAAEVRHDGAGGATVLAAGRDLALGTVQLAEHDRTVWDRRNWNHREREQELGTQVQAAGPVTLAAGRDLTARAASVSSEQGALVAQAGRDLTLQAGSSRQLDEEARYVKKKGLVSSKRTTTYDRVEHTGAQATTFSGATVHLSAGQDLAVVGSQVASDHATTLVAGRDVTLQAATETLHEQHFKETKKSGLFSSGATLTVGTQQKSLDARASQSRAAASTVGSVEGDVRIQAGGTYRQSGSDVLAPQGDIDLAAQRLEITEAAETHTTRTEQRFKQSGLSVGVGGALVTAAQTTAQMAQAAQRTTDPRMQALAAAAAGLHLYNNAGEIGQAAEALAQGDVSRAASLQISVGSAHSRSVSETQATEARASTVAAGGHVRLQASGAGAGSDLIVRGSDVRAGGHAWLRAEGDIDLLAAERTRHERSQQRSSSASVGISVGASTGVTASASRGRGQGQGDETTWRSTHVQAGQQVTLTSGADTTLRGAVAAAEQVQARVGGNLTVHSLQDTATYDERHRQAGGSVTLGPGPGASVSAGATRIRSDYASVTEQSALRAGDGGFDVQVAGTTTLVGGALTSTEHAVQQGRNRFDSQALVLSDVHNHARYEAKSSGGTLGVGSHLGSSTAGIGHASGRASSTTQAAISGIAGKQEARTGDAETGLAPIFDRERAKQDVQAQLAITAEFGKQAVSAAARYADDRAVELRRQGKEEEAQKWDEGGEYRVALHTSIGLLTGGVQGAVGAATAAVAVPVLGEQIAQLDLPEPVRQGLTQVAGAAVGAATGHSAGAATALTQTAQNYVSHSPFAQVRRTVSREQARLLNQCGAQCTEQDLRRIDLQLQKVEAAGNLAEVARYSGLTPQRAEQLSQLVLELLPVYGNAEAVVQLVTGKTSVTGEEASRFWAAVGVVPVAGGLVKKVGEPSVEALAQFFKGADTVKPLASAAEASSATSATQAARLSSELNTWAKIAPDTSRDAEYLAKTDRSVLQQYNFDMSHVLAGEINASGRATGYHAEFAADGAARIKPGAQVLYHPNGTYEAPVQVWDANKGVWLDKKNISTFFPPSWSQARIEYEVAEAFKAAVQAGRDPLKSFQFDSPSGIKIQFHWDAKNQRTTFYPLKP